MVIQHMAEVRLLPHHGARVHRRRSVYTREVGVRRQVAYTSFSSSIWLYTTLADIDSGRGCHRPCVNRAWSQVRQAPDVISHWGQPSSRRKTLVRPHCRGGPAAMGVAMPSLGLIGTRNRTPKECK